MHDERDRYIWLLVIMAVLGIGLPGFVRSGTPASPGPSAATEPAGEGTPAQDVVRVTARDNQRPDGFFGPFQAAFACDQPPPSPELAEPDFGAWVDRCRLGDMARVREAIVAIVPDPLDSMYEHTFDRLLEAIHRATGQAGYLRDRYYLPWQVDLATARHRDKSSAPATATREREPGLLLFRRQCRPPPAASTASDAAPCTPGLLAVLLVGETSIWGVHHRALERALVVADTLETDARDRTLRILGPTFSGSIPSLREELEHYPCKHPMRHRGFEVVTGSATAATNGKVMTAPWHRDLRCRLARWFNPDPTITYHATVTDDDETRQRFYTWLAEKMDLTVLPEPAAACTLAGVGILTGTDTEHGDFAARSAGGEPPGWRARSPAECTGKAPWSRLRPELVVRYPSRVAHLRSIYERARTHNTASPQLPIEDPRRMLDLSLADSDEPIEALPAFSDKTQLSDELVFTGSLKAMCRSDLRFLGIIATDIIDRLFLAREARRYCPNLRLFTIESDVLFAHPDVGDEMNGSLIVTAYPLFPQNGAWTPRLARGTIAPFGDSTAQGVYNAALRLLERHDQQLIEVMPPRLSAPLIDNAMPVWVAAGGNGTLWPVAVIASDAARRPREARAADGQGLRREPASDDKAASMFVTSGQWKWTFSAIWLACTILAAGYWLGRYAPGLRVVGLDAFRVFRPVDGRTAEHAVFSLLALVPVTCAYVAAAGLVLAERILQQPHSSHVFAGSLLSGLVAGCRPLLPGVPAVVTWVALTAACADAVIAPAIAALPPTLRGRASDRQWLHAGVLISVALVLVAFLALRRGLVFDRNTWITLRDRAITASSGLSPLVPACAFAVAVFVAARMQLARMHHGAERRVSDPMAECEHPAVTGMRTLRERTLAIVHRYGGGPWPGALLTLATFAVWWLGGIPLAMTMLEGPVWNWPLTLAMLVGLVLVLASYVPFVLGCRRLRGYLRRHATLPSVDAYSRLPGRAAYKMSEILVKPPAAAEMGRALQQLRLLASQVRATRLQIDDELRAKLQQALNAASTIQDALQRELDPAAPAADPAASPAGAIAAAQPGCTTEQLLYDVAVTLARVVASQWGRPATEAELAATSAGLCKLAPELAPDQRRALPTAELYERAADNETRIWLRLAEDFVVTRSTAFFHEVLHMLRRLLTAATVAAMLLLAGASSYPFERRPMLLFMMQGLVVVMVIATIAILSSMENSEVLARIRKVEAGKVTWNRSFIVKIALYGMLPILSVVATQLPSVGSALFGWLPALFGLMQ